MASSEPIYLALISIHGLIRGHDLELGRDSDTGGQTKYVVEVARALAEREDVGRVDLFTRRVVDPGVSTDYAEPEEELAPGARIVRIEAGPPGYIHKEALWGHLDTFADNVLEYLRQEERTPHIVHSHYADAGYVGLRVANHLGVPLVHTGHSLGRVKRRRLIASGLKSADIDERYSMSTRIEAEEDTLANAELVIASTRNEIEDQYGLYDHYQPDQMVVNAPGTDLRRFMPPTGREWEHTVFGSVRPFLRSPRKPMILALSRPDERKNLATLITAYGESAKLREKANLVIVAGNRDDIRTMEASTQQVLTNLLLLIDAYDLYGKVAYPKHHKSDHVPAFYRLAAASGGVFINPALTEPFGLTLIEAAASRLPIVATEDGGPQDIIGHCRNGLLIDPLNVKGMAEALLELLNDRQRWERFAENGLEGAHRHYSWEAHAERYMESIRPIVDRSGLRVRKRLYRKRTQHHDRAIFTDLDQNLLGDRAALNDFLEFVRRNRRCAGFGIATGRSLESALKIMRRYGIPEPDVLITSVGTEIYYAPELTADSSWAQHIDHLWTPKRVRKVLDDIPGVAPQPAKEQTRFKVSYYIDPAKAPSLDEIHSLLHQADQTVHVFLSFGQFLDVVPVRASKGSALRYFAEQFEIPLEHILAAGGSGTDADMMRGNTLAVVVANRHDEELSHLVDTDSIYFARASYARGILEAIDHYDFYGECRVPDPVEEQAEGTL